MVRLVLILLGVIITGCAPASLRTERINAKECAVSKLEQVFLQPIKYDGRMFCGVAVAVIHRRVVAFYPTLPLEEEEYSTVVLPELKETSLYNAKTGEKFFITGIIKVDKKCFNGYTCSPFLKPIILIKFSFIKV